MFKHEALTLLIHEDACSIDTILMNGLEKMHHATIVYMQIDMNLKMLSIKHRQLCETDKIKLS